MKLRNGKESEANSADFWLGIVPGSKEDIMNALIELKGTEITKERLQAHILKKMQEELDDFLLRIENDPCPY